MCQAISYNQQKQRIKVYFTAKQAQLPLYTRNQQQRMFTWGRRLQEVGQLPQGSVVMHEIISSDAWQQFFPKPVKIAADGFLLRDLEDRIRYYPLVEGQLLQGLLARYKQETRVYIVVEAVTTPGAIHTYWPRIINQSISIPDQLQF